MNACFSMTFAWLNVNDRVKLVPCFAGSPKSPDANLSFIEIESRLREKIRVNAAELRQVSNLQCLRRISPKEGDLQGIISSVSLRVQLVIKFVLFIIKTL